MGRRIHKVFRHLSAEELDKRIKKLERDTKILKRLRFIRNLYTGMSVEKAAKTVGVTKATGYLWLKRWNSNGYKGLIPKSGGGRPPKLNEEEKKVLTDYIKRRELTVREVQEFIEKYFNVKYSPWQVRRILNSLGVNYKSRKRKKPG